jgi:hypothetical protein
MIMAIKETIEMAREVGWKKAFYDLFYRGANRLTYYKVLQAMIVKLEHLDQQYLKTESPFTFKLMLADDLKLYAHDTSLQLSEEFLETAKLKNDYCMAVFDRDKLVSYGWYSNQPTQINDELLLNFNSRYVYMYKGFTAVDYRGKRLHALGMARALHEFSKIGFEGLISYVEKNNFSSLKSCYRMGYKNIGQLMIAKTPWKYLMMRDKGCHDYQFNVQAVTA